MSKMILILILSLYILNIECEGSGFYPAPKFSEIDEIYIGDGDEAAKELDTHFKDIFKNNNYNSLHFGLEFLDLMEQERKIDPNITYSKIYTKFNPKSNDGFAKKNSFGCVGFGIYICDQIPSKYKKYCFVVGGQLISDFKEDFHLHAPPYHHLSNVIKYKNPQKNNECGYLLLDYSWPLPQVLNIRENYFKYVTDSNKKKGFFFVEKKAKKNGVDKIIWYRIKDGKVGEIDSLPLLKLNNPDEAITKPTTFTNTSYLIFTYNNEGGIEAGIIQNFVEGEIIIYKGSYTTTIAFNDRDKLKDIITSDFANMLKMDRTLLLTQLERVIDNQNYLIEARKELLSLDKNFCEK